MKKNLIEFVKAVLIGLIIIVPLTVLYIWKTGGL